MHGTYLRLGLHVSATDREVIRQASTKLQPRYRFDCAYRGARHIFYRNMLDEHRAAKTLFTKVTTGDFA